MSLCSIIRVKKPPLVDIGKIEWFVHLYSRQSLVKALDAERLFSLATKLSDLIRGLKGYGRKKKHAKKKSKLDVAFNATQLDFLLKELHPSFFEIL